MTKTENDARVLDVVNAIKNSLEDARSTVRELARVFTDNVRSLRAEENEDVLLQLSQNVRDLAYVMEFIKELSGGLKCCNNVDIPADPIIDNNTGMQLFMEMNSALETRDWIMLSDLVEYELSPLLIKEEEWLGDLDKKLTKCLA